MLFSSLVFVILFLPIALVVHWILPEKFRNIWLLIMSLAFYMWGEKKLVLLMLIIIVWNYIIAQIESNIIYRKARKIILIIGISGDLSVLFVFKYLNFMLGNLVKLGLEISVLKLVLPIGISFFTFQALSYIVDVYYEKVECQHSIVDLGLYIAFFPQLVAGPIIRYSSFQKQLKNRKIQMADLNVGIERFIVGLSKKVILANSFAEITDYSYSLVESQGGTTMMLAWLGAIGYSLQIYFDFSGYSDMAIGLAKMFGFDFAENFNYPYISKSINEFWRRWHISLSSWFRDYLYIPLGGSKVSENRWILNMCIVWLCTGLWHGAAWTFVAWGMGYCILLICEKKLKLPTISNSWLWEIGYRILVLLVIIVMWVIFRANGLRCALKYLISLTPFTDFGIWNADSLFYFTEYKIIWVIGIVACIPILRNLNELLKNRKGIILLKRYVFPILLIILLLICIANMFKQSYNPFIYFNF